MSDQQRNLAEEFVHQMYGHRIKDQPDMSAADWNARQAEEMQNRPTLAQMVKKQAQQKQGN